jgi:hypothetical protein
MDPDEGDLGSSSMAWKISLLHCLTAVDCHAHPQGGGNGISSGVTVPPPHSYPAYLEFELTVTDAGGLSDTAVVRIDPRTVNITVGTIPAGLSVLAGEAQGASPLTVTAIVGSRMTITAPNPQTQGPVTYEFVSWSDGGGASHEVVPGSADVTYTATYRVRPVQGTAVLVVGNGGAPAAGDLAVRNRLMTLGYTVTTVDDSASRSTDATGKDLVVITSTVLASNVNTKFRNVAVPVITWEHALFDDLAMTSAGGVKRTGVRDLVITTPAHPLAAGLTGTVQVATAVGDFASGTPNGNAVVVATVPGTTTAGIFAYESGAAMPGRSAPARRVGLFLGDATPTILTAAGQALFDAAVGWADG